MSEQIISALIEAAEHIEYICNDVPDVLTQLPEDNRLRQLIDIKKVAKQMIKYANSKADLRT